MIIEKMPKNAKKYMRNVSFSDSDAIKMTETNSPGNGYYLPPAGRTLKTSPSLATLSRLDRQKIVLWKRPVQTINYFVRELFLQIFENLVKLCRSKRLVALFGLLSLVCYCLYVIPGPHSPLVDYFERKMAWCLYWVFLGVLSSVGLGTGLHTFLLYLGPHIASVTLAAYECQSLRFPEPPYPDQIVCPYSNNNHNGAGGGNNSSTVDVGRTSVASDAKLNDVDDLFDATIGTLAASSMISLWSIMSKVRLEAFMWGAGTALGELPPYFMAKAARLSGEEPDDEEYREFVEFMRQQGVEQYGATGPPRHLWARVKLAMQKLIESVGFFGILLCASIPNPLFDLAGITCGHFLVSFWTFFGATLIGKAVIKMHIQKLFVILAFSEHHVERCVLALKRIPKVGPYLQSPFKELLVQQKLKFHQGSGAHVVPQKNGILQRFFELIFVAMVAYFLVSLINSLAQNYDRRLYQRYKKTVLDDSTRLKESKHE